MKKFKILVSDEAVQDLNNLKDVIKNEYKSPLTAKRYITGLRKEITKLHSCADSIAVHSNNRIKQKYGINVRRVNYKKMTIFYILSDEYVIIKAIIPSNTIAGL